MVCIENMLNEVNNYSHFLSICNFKSYVWIIQYVCILNIVLAGKKNWDWSGFNVFEQKHIQ